MSKRERLVKTSLVSLTVDREENVLVKQRVFAGPSALLGRSIVMVLDKSAQFQAMIDVCTGDSTFYWEETADEDQSMKRDGQVPE